MISWLAKRTVQHWRIINTLASGTILLRMRQAGEILMELYSNEDPRFLGGV